MTVRIEEREIKQPRTVERRVVSATCDRCGRAALCANDSLPGRRGAGPWGECDVLIQGGGIGHADLCGRCAEEFIGWVNGGAGRLRRGGGIQVSP